MVHAFVIAICITWGPEWWGHTKVVFVLTLTALYIQHVQTHTLPGYVDILSPIIYTGLRSRLIISVCYQQAKIGKRIIYLAA